MENVEELKKQIGILQKRLENAEREIKRPSGQLSYMIYTDDYEKKYEYTDEAKWVEKLFSLAGKSNCLYVQYYLSFNKEKDCYDNFIQEWKKPTKTDIQSFLRAVYSPENYLQLDSLEIGIANKKDVILSEAKVIIPSFEELKEQIEAAKQKNDKSFFDVIKNWKLEYV